MCVRVPEREGVCVWYGRFSRFVPFFKKLTQELLNGKFIIHWCRCINHTLRTHNF